MKVRTIAAVVVCLSWAGLLRAQTPQEAEKKALQRFVSRLPRIDTSSVACPPFDARFEWKVTNGGFRADFRYRRPDRLDVLVTDDADGAPCALYRDKTVMFFDPASPKFVVANDYMLDFGFRQGEDGKVAVGANFGFGSENVQRVRIDVAQVMQIPEGVLTNQNSTDSVIRLRQTRGDWRDELELQLTEPPVCILKSFEGDAPEPHSSMRLTLFPKDSPPLFTAPDVEQLAKAMPVDSAKYKPTDGVLGFASGMKVIGHVFYAGHAHIGVLQPDVREEWKIPGFSMPDWEAVARNKKELGPKLRDLCGLPARSLDRDDAPLSPTLAAEESETPK